MTRAFSKRSTFVPEKKKKKGVQPLRTRDDDLILGQAFRILRTLKGDLAQPIEPREEKL